jgi:hypothetical protein
LNYLNGKSKAKVILKEKLTGSRNRTEKKRMKSLKHFSEYSQENKETNDYQRNIKRGIN